MKGNGSIILAGGHGTFGGGGGGAGGRLIMHYLSFFNKTAQPL
jgi:hypothetical protein